MDFLTDLIKRDDVREYLSHITVGVDMDDTLYPFLSKVYETHNRIYDDSINIYDSCEWNVSKIINPHCRDLWTECVTKEMFDDIKISRHIREAITLLYYTVGKVIFVTAGHPDTMSWRNELLKRSFEWYNDNMLICRPDKENVKMQYLIDDNPEYSLRENTGNLVTLCPSRPWNAHIHTIVSDLALSKNMSKNLYLCSGVPEAIETIIRDTEIVCDGYNKNKAGCIRYIYTKKSIESGGYADINIIYKNLRG